MKKSDAMKTLILETASEGMKRVTIPAHWRVTFGNTLPYNPKHGFAGGSSNISLRLYDGTTQTAVFSDVVSFRDASIKIEERITKVKRMQTTKHGRTGDKAVEVEGRATEWVNPDEAVDPATAKEEDFLELEDLRGKR